jgi:phosphatidylserine decarboxylase
MRVAKDAFIFVVPLLAAAVLFYFLQWSIALGAVVALTLFILFFFRDPERLVPEDARAIVAPADGRVQAVEPVNVEGETHTRVSIFLSVFDVHINRSPIAGRVIAARYHRGKFDAAFKKRVSAENEQNRLTIAGERAKVEVAQIAGLIARRIVCYKREGDWVNRGERIGLIKFGSKTDCLLPPGVEVAVKVGDRVRGASSVIARFEVGS